MTIQLTINDIPAGRINPVLLAEELEAAGLNPTFSLTQGPGQCDALFQEGNAAALQAVLDAHDPDALSTEQQDAANRAAQNQDLAVVLPHLKALRALPAEDAAYALMGRAMAYKDGASGEVINGIVDRATAAAYITSKDEWANLPATSKAWTADMLDMFAFILQIVIVTK
jgi:hypothetical protein